MQTHETRIVQQFDGVCPECGCGLHVTGHGRECSNTNCTSRRQQHGLPAAAANPAAATVVGEKLPPPKDWEMRCIGCGQKLYQMADVVVCTDDHCVMRMTPQ